MTRKRLEEVLNESNFPGNTAAFEELVTILQEDNIIGFVGAGASVPNFPTWPVLLHHLIHKATTSGMLTDLDGDELKAKISTEPLEVALDLEDALSKQSFRNCLAAMFRGNSGPTAAQKMIIGLGCRGIVTLNYDQGLEDAYVEAKHKMPTIIRSQDTAEMTRWLQGHSLRGDTLVIAHIHGLPSDPEGMVITSDDYHRHYGSHDSQEFLKTLWRCDRMLVVGFGFKDPFLLQVIEKTMRALECDARHFALIGRKGEGPSSPRSRLSFIRKYRLRPIFYEIRVDPATGAEDHSDLTALLENLQPPTGGNSNVSVTDGNYSEAQPERSDIQVRVASGSESPAITLEESLFIGPRGKALYVEPRLQESSGQGLDDAVDGSRPVTVESIVTSNKSFLVLAYPEYGSTSLCRRLLNEFRKVSKPVFMHDATKLPNYKKKLEALFLAAGLNLQHETTIILDNFDLDQHERLLKELVGLTYFKRFIIFSQRSIAPLNVGLQVEAFPMDLQVLDLVHLTRGDIRTLATNFYDTSDTNLVSKIVDTIYEDLTSLCVPMTPFNVILFLKILHRDGDFHPINRVQIIGRYLSDLLQRPSDVYSSSFNVRNKIDVICAFVFSIYRQKLGFATKRYWSDFCSEYMKKTLIAFDEAALLRDLIETRLLLVSGDNIYFKYRFFYEYFLGTQVANRPVLLQEFMRDDSYLSTDNLVEVISGSSADNSALVNDLSVKLEQSVEQFSKRYFGSNADPFVSFVWPISVDDEEKLWVPVTQQLDAGPRPDDELDTIKSCLAAESRTENQQVIIQSFDKAERKMVEYHQALISALQNSDNLEGLLKLRAMKLIYEGYNLIYRVALLHAASIADNKFFIWNGLTFINVDYNKNSLEARAHRIFAVMCALSPSIAHTAADRIASKKLGEVHAALAETGQFIGFENLLNFACIIRSKGREWSSTANNRIHLTDRHSFYLRKMLSITMKEFKEEVNTGKEREDLKRIVAAIRVKRELNKSNLNSKVVSRMVDRLQAQDLFKTEHGAAVD